MNKLEFSSMTDFLYGWISETLRGDMFLSSFLFSNSQVQAVEISSPRKPKMDESHLLFLASL
jgi:hypothetical protein